MCRTSHDVGAVAGLRRVKQAAAVALAVMQHTSHSLLVGDLGKWSLLDRGRFHETHLTNLRYLTNSNEGVFCLH